MVAHGEQIEHVVVDRLHVEVRRPQLALVQGLQRSKFNSSFILTFTFNRAVRLRVTFSTKHAKSCEGVISFEALSRVAHTIFIITIVLSMTMSITIFTQCEHPFTQQHPPQPPRP